MHLSVGEAPFVASNVAAVKLRVLFLVNEGDKSRSAGLASFILRRGRGGEGRGGVSGMWEGRGWGGSLKFAI